MSRAFVLNAAKFKVSGRVQGVFFRKHTKTQADKLNVTGWVRNTTDGMVEGYIEGREPDVQKMKQWLQSTGSPHSIIEMTEFTNECTLTARECNVFKIER